MTRSFGGSIPMIAIAFPPPWRGCITPGNGGQYAIEYRTVGIEDRVERQIYTWGRVFFDLKAGQAVRVVGVTGDISERNTPGRSAPAGAEAGKRWKPPGRRYCARLQQSRSPVINGYSDMLIETACRSTSHCGISPKRSGLPEMRRGLVPATPDSSTGSIPCGREEVSLERALSRRLPRCWEG